MQHKTVTRPAYSTGAAAASRRACNDAIGGRAGGDGALCYRSYSTSAAGGMAQSILVTGGAGYIGSHACKALARAGYRPVVFDNLSRGHREAVRWGPLVEGDLADSVATVAPRSPSIEVAAVMHFAAYAYVGESVSDPALYYRNNLVRQPVAARGDAGSGRRRDRLLLDLRDLRHPRRRADPRRRAAAPGQPLWRDQARDRAGAALVRRSLRDALGVAALFQRRRRRFGRRDRRMPRARDPSGSAGARRRRSADGRRSMSSAPTIRRRTAPRSATTSMSRTSPIAHLRALERLRAGGASIALNLGTGQRPFGARGDRRRRGGQRPQSPGAGRAAAAGRSAGAGRRPEPRGRDSWLAGAAFRPRHDRPHRLCLAYSALPGSTPGLACAGLWSACRRSGGNGSPDRPLCERCRSGGRPRRASSEP